MKGIRGAAVLLGAHLALFLGVLIFWAFVPTKGSLVCRMMIGGWHPDVPQEVVIEGCQLPKKMT